MRVISRYEGAPLEEARSTFLRNRVAWSLSSASNEIRSISAHFHDDDGEIGCRLTVRLVGRREVRIASRAATFEEVVDFVLARAQSAIMRRLENARIFGT